MLTKRRKTIDTILGQAKIVRDTLMDITASSRGFCYEASCVLGKRLEHLGISPKLVGGAVRLASGYDAGHFWLEHKGIIIDITGDQFNGSLRPEDELPEIVFTKSRNVPVYRKFSDQELPQHHNHWHGSWASAICPYCNGFLIEEEL